MKANLRNATLRRWLLGAVLAAGIAGCSRSTTEEVPPTEPEVTDPPCGVLPPAPTSFGYNYDYVFPLWRQGCYNPANAEEAAVVAEELDATNGVSKRLYRLNLRTGQRTLLVSVVTGDDVDWSRTGWILYGFGGEAWKIKANGDSATQITSTGYSLSVEKWSPDGQSVLCRRRSAIYAEAGLAIYTVRGAFVRLLPNAIIQNHDGAGWSPDGRRLAYIGGPGFPVNAPRLCLYDLTTNQLTTLDVIPRRYAGMSGVRWLPNGTEVVWGGAASVGITNVQTGQTHLVRTACPDGSRSFGGPCPSPDGQQLLLFRETNTVSPTDNSLLLMSRSLETTSLQGTKIRQVTP